jgi:hypothetical protein
LNTSGRRAASGKNGEKKMSTPLDAKWKNAPAVSPVKFYSELDTARWEKRKVEVFQNGHMGYASTSGSSNDGTRLAIGALPRMSEIARQIESEARSVSADGFESIWKLAAT